MTSSRRPDLARALAVSSADVATALVESGAVDVGACRSWLLERGFDVALYDSLVEKAKVG